ncbi:MAG: chemotaxis protein CheW [Candidatus Nitrotoga sp.]
MLRMDGLNPDKNMNAATGNITEPDGHTEPGSMEGRGSRMTIRFPLTLTTLDGWSVLVGSQTCIVPLNAIIEFIPGNAAKLKTVAGGYLLRVQDEYIPVITMHRILNVCTSVTAPECGILIVLEAEGGKVALLVDELLAQHQVVLKNLEINFRKVPCISGVTVMGNGLVVFILDAGALVRHGQAVPVDAYAQQV